MSRTLIFLIAIAALVIFLAYQFPYALGDNDDKMHLLYSATILTLIALGVRRLPMNETLKYTAAWIGVFLLLILGYSYKDTLLNTRVAGELMPNRARLQNDGTMLLKASKDGHFYVEARVNGIVINFMIDTGASDIALNQKDAERIGFDIEKLNYTRTYRTANGTTGGAPVQLKRLQIGNFILNDFPASVNQGELGTSLLGMSALRELGGFRIDGNEMMIGKEN